MVDQPLIDRRKGAEGAEGAKNFAELRAFSANGFSESASRMGAIEANLGKHTKILEKNVALTVALGDRFDTFESTLNVERRIKDAALARSLDEWKNFMILKVDESTAASNVIGENQTLHMKATDGVRAELATVVSSISSVLSIVSTVEVVKKTAGRFGRCGLWVGGWVGKTTIWFGAVAAALVAIKTAMAPGTKIQWPWI